MSETRMSERQIEALTSVIRAVVETVQGAGPTGAPGGVMFAALSAQGCTKSQFDSLMGTLVQSKRLVKRGECYFINPVYAELVGSPSARAAA